jgi:hypothetical protein
MILIKFGGTWLSQNQNHQPFFFEVPVRVVCTETFKNIRKSRVKLTRPFAGRVVQKRQLYTQKIIRPVLGHMYDQ